MPLHRIAGDRGSPARDRRGAGWALGAVRAAVGAVRPAVGAVPGALSAVPGAMSAVFAVLAVACGFALGAAPAAAACSGRSLLTCAEKQQTSSDVLVWTYAFRLDTVPFETRTPLHLSDPGLRRFWAFETSTAAARSMYELLLVLQGTDPDFETVATAPRFSRPMVPRTRLVGRSLARVLGRLMQAEQDEVAALAGLVASMNRATEASAVRGRSDWVRWQLSAAAGFASQASRALGRVIAAQRTASRALVHERLRFGIGTVDVKLARRQVRRHGLAGTLRTTMASLAMSPQLIGACASELRGAAPPAVSVNLAELLASPTTIRAELAFRAALTHFVARTPPTSRPPS